MEFEKNIGDKFTFGFGSAKTAGAGTLDKAVEAPDVRTKYDKKTIAKNAAKAAALTAAVLVKHKLKKNRKKKSK